MIIETRELRKSYDSRTGRQRTRVEAVAGLDLGVKEGEIFGLLGPNGAGKTTTLHMLATLIAPDSGEAFIDGLDLTGSPREVRRRIGYVAQHGSTGDDVTGREELVMQARMYGYPKAEAARRADRLIADFGLAEYADRRCRTYSGGQRRRVDIALGVIHGPRIVLLDEPSSGLDPAGRAVLWDEIRRLRAAGTTIVLTTHYLDEADALCDRITIVDHGQVIADGTPEELKAQVAGDVVVIGLGRDGSAATARALLTGSRGVERVEDAQDNALRLFVDRGASAIPQIMHTLDAAGLEIATLTLHQPSLDDVFLAKTGRSLRVVAEPAEGAEA